MVSPAPIKTPLLSGDGKLTVAWMLYFQALQAELDTLNTQVAALKKK